MGINLYRVNKSYCMYLHEFDRRVPEMGEEKETRPFIGILLCVNGKNFFAPLTSPKQKHLHMKETQDFLKIYEGKLGGINLNNMIPIPRRFLEKIYLEQIENNQYAHMLAMQLEWLQRNKVRITNKARNLYFLITQTKVEESLKNRCCNFKLLEEKCDEYMRMHYIAEEEILYIYA